MIAVDVYLLAVAGAAGLVLGLVCWLATHLSIDRINAVLAETMDGELM